MMIKLIIFCAIIASMTLPIVLGDACTPNPCGANTNCRVGTNVFCSCKRGYRGDPLKGCVKAECSEHNECATNKACHNGYCVDICAVGICGPNARCRVENHRAVCSCPQGFYGNDPINRGCREMTDSDYCNPSPCGTKAVCSAETNSVGKKIAMCRCPDGYYGNALEACIRGECRNNNDCANDKVCIRAECINPCPYGCGIGALCRAKNHMSVCSCPPHKTGNPLVNCN